MKKQLLRVKQLADQTFSRAGKTDVLSDDLQEADRKVEYIKTSCQNVGKKLPTCILVGQQQGESGTKEKLLKKSPYYQLGATMVECGNICDDESLMKVVLNKCGYVEKCISEESVEHDHRVEQHVIAPLQNVLETDIPNIIKQKKNVTKVCLDMDSAKTRYQQAQKHNSNTAGAAKVESIKDELKDSEQKVEQSRDVLACEMFHLAARESELCYTILQYYKFRKRYHEYALSVLDSLIPELENEICSSKIKPVYGIHLEEHLRVTNRKIAFPIEVCVCALLELGMDEEGLFRLTGSASKVKRMKLSFDAGCMTLPTALAYKDPHVIAGALKSYLRELPEPLLTHDLYDDWLNAAKAQTHPDNKLQALWTVVHKLPQANFDNLSYLIKFFHVLSKNHEVNKMCPHNIAIVIAPSLIWTKEENGSSGFGLNVNVSLYPSIIDLLVTYADWFFDKNMDFYQTLYPVVSEELDEKPLDKGIDNKGFDIKVADKMHKSVCEKNHPGGDSEMNSFDIKRSQSINSLSEDGHVHESPRPITRRKNKSVAPVPPIFKEEKKKEAKKDVSPNQSEKPDKPPRPSVSGNATLPRPGKSHRENKSTDTVQDSHVGPAIESSDKSVKKEKTVKSVSTNTDTQVRELKPVAAPRLVTSPQEGSGKADGKPSEYNAVDMISVKKEWLLGKSSENVENVPKKPAVPERPSTLKTQPYKFNRTSFDVNTRNNYENVCLSSNENLSNGGGVDERTLQKTQIYSIEKQQVAIIKVGNEEKKAEGDDNSEAGKVGKEEKEEKEEVKDSSHDRDVVVEERNAVSNTVRPSSLPGTDKPERPPKPDKILSTPSHMRTFSDGQITEMKPCENPNNISNNNNNNNHNHNSNNNNNNNNNINSNNNNHSENDDSSSHCVKFVVNLNKSEPTSPTQSIFKHPTTSPPPPPVPAKPTSNSHGESTDF